MGLNRFSLPAVAVIMMINAMLLSQGCLEEERIALLQIKTSFGDHPNDIPSSLLSWGKDALCCSWEGVTCSNSTTRRVIEINLYFTRYWSLEDLYLNASIFLPFQELNVLDLSGNGIAGCVANEGFERLSRLAKLEVLSLGDNFLNNSILSSFKRFSSLKHLYLDNNGFQDSIDMKGSEGPSRLNKLESLNLSSNYLNDSTLSFLKGLSSLKYLYLDYNQLYGSINTKEFDSLSNLKVLSLFRNKIQDFVTLTEIDSLSKLEVLSLSKNSIHSFSKSRENTGFSNLSILYLDYVFSEARVFILQSLSAFPNLKVLSMRYYDLFNIHGQGILPNLKFLERLDLTESSLVNYNFFQTVGKFTSLKSLILPNSGLSGPISAPHGLCELKHLHELDISHNDLNGSLPSCLLNLTNLQALDISFNNFTGNISLSPIGSLVSIQDLNISDNHFQIPISLGPFFNLSKLKHLNGDRNEIYESTELVHNLIPRFQLQRLSLACTGSGGTFPKSLYYQHDLQFVDLSHIKMTGEFPSWLLQNNTKLEGFYLVNNSLSGSFQLANHSLVRLSHLDISRNRIYNQIPTEIGACFPSVAHNNLSGKIPEMVAQFSTFKKSTYEENPLLCGPPLTNNCFGEISPSSLSWYQTDIF
uniref:Leucine-rich repeat-containing N-terminal plant-type domain-containing protein n=1 Tax=Populus trichocarpa TaxID=3694 RepID=A0A3N7FB27_POPTR